MTDAHDTPRFRNSVTYTAAITFTVAGGARWKTAYRRAEQIAERLANAAARSRDTVEVTAVAGPSHEGEIFDARPVRFAEANSGRSSYAAPTKLERYLDPDHERALLSLAAANTRYRQRQEADRERRRAVDCVNAYGLGLLPSITCRCVYCAPDEHELSLRLADEYGPGSAHGHWCLCGEPIDTVGGRCPSHRDVTLVVLDGDPAALQVLARRLHGETSA